jgi:hypothetical protein
MYAIQDGARAKAKVRVGMVEQGEVERGATLKRFES